ncbi:hypothetical protein V1264_010017 [Littorina saxatilis]|uniref:Uncharacterized protein n=1 Tax=Littorina saxatilis TaxID=31220 RepID=A0AAN9G047_9CAEN
MSGSLLLLILTARLEAFFALFVVAGAHRTCCNVIPSAVMNDVIQAEAEKNGAGRSAPVGLAMSPVSLMNLVAYFTVFPVLGPLERITGHSSVSLCIAAGCSCLAAVVFLMIDLPKQC